MHPGRAKVTVKHLIMKKHTLTILLLSLLASCQSKEDKAKATIKTYINEHTTLYKDYQPVSYGTLDSDMYVNQYPEERAKLQHLADSLQAEADAVKNHVQKPNEYSLEVDTAYERAMEKSDAILAYKNKLFQDLISKIEHTRPVFIGYKLQHTFKTIDNKNTGLTRSEIFHLNPTLDSVADIEN